MSRSEAGHVVGGRYRLEKILGEGGMAVVWQAVHTETDRKVALKLVRPNLLENADARDLFVREARIAARIGRSEHIVDVLDAGVDAELGVPFIVMELLVGEPLDAHLRRRGAIVGEDAAEIVLQLGEALDQAHAAGVVHRDLKPQNLFLGKDRKGRPLLKILDFGIAKLAETVQQSATQIGTPAYSAPEQLGASWRTIAEKQGATVASTVSPGTDVWAMGLVVYEMLTASGSGDLWGATTIAELPVKIVLEPTPVASSRAGSKAGNLPVGFDGWLARCLALDASKRWPEAGEAARAVAAMLRGAPRERSAEPSSAVPLVRATDASRFDSARAASSSMQAPFASTHPSTPPPGNAVSSGAPTFPSATASPAAAPTGAPVYPSALPTYPAAPPAYPSAPPAYPATSPAYPSAPPAYPAAPPAYPSAPPAYATGGPWGAPTVDPRVLAWARDRGIEIATPQLAELRALEPWTFLPKIGRVGAELRARIDEASIRVVEAFGADVVSQAMGEERLVIAFAATPRPRGRAAVRSKMSSGLADDIGRGLKLLDGLVASTGLAKSIGDPVLEARFDVSAPSVHEGAQVLTVGLRHLLVTSAFRGVIELRPGIVAVHQHDVRALDPAGLDFLLAFVANVLRSLV